MHHDLTDDYGVSLAPDLARDPLMRCAVLLTHGSVGREEDRVEGPTGRRDEALGGEFVSR
jgi:hypothetical protein